MKISIIPYFFCLLLFAGCVGNANDVKIPKSGEKDTIQKVEATESDKENPEVTSESHKPGLENYDGVWYFSSTSPNADKATPLYEYFKMIFEGDSIRGRGWGDWMQGSDPWSLTMTGVFISKNKLKMKLVYTPENSESFSSEETWEMSLDEYGVYRIYRKNWSKLSQSFSVGGADEYAEETLEYIPEFYREKFKEVKFQSR